MVWTERDLVTVGYWPQRRTGRPAWLDAPMVKLPCNVTACNDAWPKAASLPWLHNGVGLFASDALARAAVPPGEQASLLVCGARALPILFDLDEELPCALPQDSAPIPAGFVSLGYDAVQCGADGRFECSPLLCNGVAASLATNRWCLFEALQDAITAARRWTDQDAEPGPYVVVQVWAERMPDAASPSRAATSTTALP